MCGVVVRPALGDGVVFDIVMFKRTPSIDVHHGRSAVPGDLLLSMKGLQARPHDHP